SATHFVVSAPGHTTAGIPIAVVVTAEDQVNNTVSGYSGTGHLSSSDRQAALRVDRTVTGGIGFFAALLKKVGSASITANDVANSSVSGMSSAIVVAAAPVNHFLAKVATLPSYPGVPTAYPTTPSAASVFANTGAPVVFTVSALDQFGNVVPG